MKNRKFYISIILYIATGEFALAHQDTDIQLSDVPGRVIQVARDARPGIELTEAERINDDGIISYELEGHVGNKHFEIQVSEEGVLGEIEQEDD